MQRLRQPWLTLPDTVFERGSTADGRVCRLDPDLGIAPLADLKQMHRPHQTVPTRITKALSVDLDTSLPVQSVTWPSPGY